MKIGIVGNGFVGKATQIFAKNYFAKDENDNAERYEVLPDTASTPARADSVRTYTASLSDVNTATPLASIEVGGWTPPFFKRLLFKPIVQVSYLVVDMLRGVCHKYRLRWV